MEAVERAPCPQTGEGTSKRDAAGREGAAEHADALKEAAPKGCDRTSPYGKPRQVHNRSAVSRPPGSWVQPGRGEGLVQAQFPWQVTGRDVPARARLAGEKRKVQMGSPRWPGSGTSHPGDKAPDAQHFRLNHFPFGPKTLAGGAGGCSV